MPKKKRGLHQVTRQRALAVLARMRSRGESLSKAAAYESTTPNAVRKEVGNQLTRGPTGRYVATSGDTLRRDLNVLGFDGYEPVVVRSSKKARASRRSWSISQDGRCRMAQTVRRETRCRCRVAD